MIVNNIKIYNIKLGKVFDNMNHPSTAIIKINALSPIGSACLFINCFIEINSSKTIKSVYNTMFNFMHLYEKKDDLLLHHP